MNLNQQLKQFIKFYINKKTEKAIVPIIKNGKVMNNYWIDNMENEYTYKMGIEIDTKKYKEYNYYTQTYSDKIIPTFTLKIYKPKILGYNKDHNKIYRKKFCSHEYEICRETYDIKSCYWNEGDYTTGGLTMEEAEYDLKNAIIKWIKNSISMYEGIPDNYLSMVKKKKALKIKIYKPMTDEKYFRIYIN
jgi:hypothetical protein